MAEIITLPNLRDSSLLAYWRLEGNSNDVQGTYNGTDTAITYSLANGKFGQGADFNGTTSKISTSLTINTYSNLSISAWVNPDNQNDGAVMFANDTPGFDNSLQMGVRPEVNAYGITKKFSMIYQRNSDATRHGVSDTADIEASVWTNYVFTYDGSNMKLYRNGLLVDTTALSSAVFSSTAVTLGFNTGSGRCWDGKLDDIAIYSRALTANEAKEIYNLQSSFFQLF